MVSDRRRAAADARDDDGSGGVGWSARLSAHNAREVAVDDAHVDEVRQLEQVASPYKNGAENAVEEPVGQPHSRQVCDGCEDAAVDPVDVSVACAAVAVAHTQPCPASDRLDRGTAAKRSVELSRHWCSGAGGLGCARV